MTIANNGPSPTTLGNVAIVTALPAASCTSTDGGTLDGGTGDGGSQTMTLPGVANDGGPEGIHEGPTVRGCGCAAPGLSAPLLLLALALRRLGRRRPSHQGA